MARQPKHDYLGQLAGRGIERQDRTRKFRGDSFHKTANVTPNQASVLNKHIAQENMYFNELIDILQPRLRNNPEFFSELTDEHIALFSLIAFCSFDVRSLLKKKSTDTELPPRLEPYRHILFGIHGSWRRTEAEVIDPLPITKSPDKNRLHISLLTSSLE